MDDLPIFYDHVHGVYRLIDTDDTDDSGVEEIPFPSSFISEDEEAVCAITESPTSKLFKAYHEIEEDDLTYVDDDRDKDYQPNQPVWHQKRGKGKTSRRPVGRPYDHHEMMMMTPEKQIGLHREPDSTQQPIRHYARKDRTPRTILKMMERHRESERVRHHTLNESMKDVCLRVPGYDPAVKETKVIQMQRIIGYECFLENTLTSLCSQLGISVKSLKLGTNFITDAMKDTPIENFYKPSFYKTSDIEDEDFVPVKKKSRSSNSKDIHNSMSDRNITRYRRHKISSPTVDSTTGDMVKVITQPINRQGSLFSSRQYLDCLNPAQTFMPIDSSQESDIKIETQSSQDDDNDLHEEIDTFIENGLYQDPDHLTSVTASFMKEEPVTTSASNDDDCGFTLASPQHGNQSFIFLRSPPRPKSIWHASHGVTNPDHYEATITSSEMQTVSPENILETKPKVSSTGLYTSPTLTRSTSNQGQGSGILFIKQEKPDDYFTENPSMYNIGQNNEETVTSMHTETKSANDSINVTISEYNSSSSCLQQPISSNNSMHTPCAGIKHSRGSTARKERMQLSSPEKNKRKRYVPFRSQLLDIVNEVRGKPKANATASHPIKPVTTQTKRYSNMSNIDRKTSSKKPTAVSRFPIKVDHRRASWMNGFMMFCQKNRAQIVRANPGVHHSHIQKIMGHMWRTMSPEEQEPYREKAKQCSNYLKKVQNEVFTEFTESIVDSSLNETASTVDQN